MKRLLFDVPKWHLIQHREHRRMPLARPDDNHILQLEDELFERLYSGETDPLASPPKDPKARAWAERFHSSCQALPAFARLAAQCKGDPAAAAAAVETILDELDDVGDPNTPPPAAPPGSQKDPMRRPLQAAVAQAAAAVDELQEALDGIEGVALSPRAGTGTETGTPGEEPRVAPLAVQLKQDSRLLRIARLAGRFKRIAANKRRQKVKHGADEVNEITQGNDLARLLPSQLAKLSHKLLRLDFFRSFLERQALQYALTGSETLGAGPLVVLLDKSDSMNGDPDVWASALSLALLSHARAEKRPFHFATFNSRITYCASVRAGEDLPVEALSIRTGGGTSISEAITHGLDHVAHTFTMRRADIVLITDGESDDSSAPSLRERAKALNVTILGLAIGLDPAVLAPWCDEAHAVHSVSTLDDNVALPLFAA